MLSCNQTVVHEILNAHSTRIDTESSSYLKGVASKWAAAIDDHTTYASRISRFFTERALDHARQLRLLRCCLEQPASVAYLKHGGLGGITGAIDESLRGSRVDQVNLSGSVESSCSMLETDSSSFANLLRVVALSSSCSIVS